MSALNTINATPTQQGVSITAAYDDGASIQFVTDQSAANLIVSLANELANTRSRMFDAENREAAMRTGDRSRLRTRDQQDAGAGQPPQANAEFLKKVWRVAPSFTLGVEKNPAKIAIDVLRYVPVSALKAAAGVAYASEVPLGNAIDVLDSVGAYMDVNGTKAKPYVPSVNGTEARRQFDAGNDKIKAIQNQANQFWEDQQ